MFSDLKISISQAAEIPEQIVAGIKKDSNTALRQILHNSRHFTRSYFTDRLIVNFRPSRDSTSGMISFSFLDDAYICNLFVQPELSWRDNALISTATFSHELGHIKFDLDTNYTIPKLFPFRQFWHHIEFRADAFAVEVNPDFLEAKKLDLSHAKQRVPEDKFASKAEQTTHPFLETRIKAAERKSYAGILADSLKAIKIAGRSDRDFDSFVDYIRNRGHYKEVQASINAL